MSNINNPYAQGAHIGHEDGKAWSELGGMLRGLPHEDSQITECAKAAVSGGQYQYKCRVWQMRFREGYLAGFRSGAVHSPMPTEASKAPILTWDVYTRPSFNSPRIEYEVPKCAFAVQTHTRAEAVTAARMMVSDGQTIVYISRTEDSSVPMSDLARSAREGCG